MVSRGQELWPRWAALGIAVAGSLDPLEDPEELLSESLEHVEEEGRLLGGVATWIWGYGHLLNLRKLKLRSKRARRIFSAIVEMSGRKEVKLRRMIQPKKKGEPEFVYSHLLPTQKEWARKDPDPFFLKQGLILKRHELIREKILHAPEIVGQRSILLRERAKHGPTLRTDVLAILPELGPISLQELARRLHVSAPTVHLVIRDLVHWGLVERTTHFGPQAKLKWTEKAAA